MTARPSIVFRPICVGAEGFEDAFLGGLMVGRVHTLPKGGSWLCWLPEPDGIIHHQWKDEKSYLAAKNALIDHVLNWLAIGGLTVAKQEAP